MTIQDILMRTFLALRQCDNARNNSVTQRGTKARSRSRGTMTTMTYMTATSEEKTTKSGLIGINTGCQSGSTH